MIVARSCARPGSALDAERAAKAEAIPRNRTERLEAIGGAGRNDQCANVGHQPLNRATAPEVVNVGDQRPVTRSVDGAGRTLL